MKKLFCGWEFWKYLVLIFSLAILLFVGISLDKSNQFEKIDIMEADGPTSILISGNISDNIIRRIVLIAVGVVLLALYLVVMNNTRKRGLKSK
jgi:Na+-transporting methylmalonyl-CoA/oxaloacetate decarboxylase beta subunit